MPVSETDKRLAQALGAGEYGASRVVLTADGDAFRLAFGRNGPVQPAFYGALLLTREALISLREQISELGEP